MDKWQYKRVIAGRAGGILKQNLDYMKSEGWELLAQNGLEYIFKRKIQQEMKTTEHKQFKPFDKVIFRPKDESYMWICGLFSNYDGKGANIIGNEDVLPFDEYDILPYEGNENLAGTTDEPEDAIMLEEGEWLIVYDLLDSVGKTSAITRFKKIEKICGQKQFIANDGTWWLFAIRFSDFNPNDMEETKKHILCVKNGKVVRYKDEKI